MTTSKYGLITTETGGQKVFHWFLAKDEIYEDLAPFLGLEHDPDPDDYDFEQHFQTASGLRARIAVKVKDSSNKPAGRRLLWVATEFLEDCCYEGNLNGLVYGSDRTITSAYIPRNEAYS